jgi:hypothetical protein
MIFISQHSQALRNTWSLYFNYHDMIVQPKWMQIVLALIVKIMIKIISWQSK